MWGEYFVEYCQSYIPLSWIGILCMDWNGMMDGNLNKNVPWDYSTVWSNYHFQDVYVFTYFIITTTCIQLIKRCNMNNAYERWVFFWVQSRHTDIANEIFLGKKTTMIIPISVCVLLFGVNVLLMSPNFLSTKVQWVVRTLNRTYMTFLGRCSSFRIGICHFYHSVRQ